MPGVSLTFHKNVGLLLVFLIAVVLAGACGSGGFSGFSIPIDDSPDDEEPVIGDVSEFNELAQLAFTLDEDTIVYGWFQLGPEAEPEPATVTAIPASGKLNYRGADKLAFSYTPNENFNGIDEFAYVTDAGQNVRVLLNVNSVDDPPEFQVELPTTAEQGRPFSVVLLASDVDSDDLLYSAANLPIWLSLDPDTGLLSGVPLQRHVGMYKDIVFRVTDDTNLSDEIGDVSIEVLDINDAPILNLTQAPETMYAREVVSFDVFPYDPDFDTAEISVEENRILSSSVSGTTITLTAADVNEVTDVVLPIRARDELGAVTRELLEITVFPRTQSGNGVTVMGHKNGPGVHIAVLGDGYTSDQQGRFREDVDRFINVLASDPGISRHLSAFNIHRIATISADSGSDDVFGDDIRETAFDSGYRCRGTQRLICANTTEVLKSTLREYEDIESDRLQHILLVNDRRYGGSGNSGGRIATTSAFFPEIAIHEMGHSLANLADEYVDPQFNLNSANAIPAGRSYANVSSLRSPTAVPWAHWINPDIPLPTTFGDEGVGVFEGGLYQATDIYRPTFNSRMREFDVPFGPVNSEQWILRLYTLTDGVRSLRPEASILRLSENTAQEFSVDPIFGDEVQATTWELNGQELDAGVNPNRITLALPAGQHDLSLTVADISGAIRVAPPHAGIFTWTWEISVE